jgi:TrpR-related protein YerC/YecD
MNSKLKDDSTDELFSAILLLKNVEECYNFFEDIGTISEIKALAQRLEVAKMLSEKKHYPEIVEKTGASTATISRVNKCLRYGADGYKLILKRLEDEKI